MARKGAPLSVNLCFALGYFLPVNSKKADAGINVATDGVRANYNGNKRFDSTSPVGSYENGKNVAGIFDLSGNVWEWTSTSPDANMSDDVSWKIVKGGSWMDGPSELRISNRRALDPAQRYQDVGFRLVREVSQ